MKRLINVLVFVSVSLIATSSFSYNSDPKILISELVKDAISTLSYKNVSLTDKNKKLHRKQVHMLVIQYHLKVKYNTSNISNKKKN